MHRDGRLLDFRVKGVKLTRRSIGRVARKGKQLSDGAEVMEGREEVS